MCKFEWLIPNVCLFLLQYRHQIPRGGGTKSPGEGEGEGEGESTLRIGGLHWHHRKLSLDCFVLQDRYSVYIIQHHNQSLNATFWAGTNNLSRITNAWIPWQQRCVSRIIGDKIDVWGVNSKPFSYKHVGVQKLYTNMAAAYISLSDYRTNKSWSLKVGPINYFQHIYGLKSSNLQLITKNGRTSFDDVWGRSRRGSMFFSSIV